MKSSDIDRLASYLFEKASTLTTDKEYPLDEINLVKELGIPVSVATADGSGPRFIVDSRGPRIEITNVAISSDRRLSPKTRYQLAHEIGHFLLQSAGVPLPINKSDYWKHESLCDGFACKL